MRAVIWPDGAAGEFRTHSSNVQQEITMTMRTLTALFDTRTDAERAQQRLGQAGIAPEMIRLIDQSTSTQSRSRPEPEGFWAKFRDFFLPNEERPIYEEGVRRGGTLLMARVEEAQSDAATAVLEECNPVDLDRRQTEWRNAGWSGSSTAPSAGPSSPERKEEGTQEEVIPVVEEQLRVGKREVNRGSVRVRAYVVEEPVQESVRLREEHVEVERRPVDQSTVATAPDDLMKERTVEMSETAEEAVVQKQAQVKEEVVVSKRTDERVEQVTDSVRRTQVDVEEGGKPSTTRAPKTARPERTDRPRH
jgi:uncharacterized protein (TIGR02271 family)